MSYDSGSSASVSALLTDIRAACASHGWTLSGNVLHKGGVFQELLLNGNFIDSRGGTGIDGSNNLTGAPDANSEARIGVFTSGFAPLVFPVSWEVFIGTAPDEVYIVVKYSSDRFQWLAWGQSTISLPGSGAWYSGSMDAVASATYGIRAYITSDAYNPILGDRGVSSGFSCPALFYATDVTGKVGECVNHGIGANTNGWSPEDTLQAGRYRIPLDYCLPNAWNSQTVLLPIQVFSSSYGSSKVAIVLDLAHARAMRIDYYAPGDVITLGADKWKVFPWHHKSNVESATSTGRMGWAIRYDGP